MPCTCLAISSESPMTSTSPAPSSRTRSSPSSNARYSATLLVAVPSSCECSPSSSPDGDVITHAAAAGPGLPRAPPSTWTISFIGGKYALPRGRAARGAGAQMALGNACQRGKIAGYARPATVAHYAPLDRVGGGLRSGTPTTGTPVELAPVDDHRDVLLALVVALQLRIELIGQRSWHHAIDHREPILLRGHR